MVEQYCSDSAEDLRCCLLVTGWQIARKELKKGIQQAKHRYKLFIEEHFMTLMDCKGGNHQVRHKATTLDTTISLHALTHQTAERWLTAHSPVSPGKICTEKNKLQQGCWTRRCLVGHSTYVHTNWQRLSSTPSFCPYAMSHSLSASNLPLLWQKSAVTCLNDYQLVALAPVIMKWFKRVILKHIIDKVPVGLDSHQYATALTDLWEMQSPLHSTPPCAHWSIPIHTLGCYPLN